MIDAGPVGFLYWEMDQLDPETRLALMRFVCSFAWTDLKVSEKERDVIRKMVDRYEFDAATRAQIRDWLEVPPRADEVDPTDVSRQHREVFLAAVREVVASDGMVAAESDALKLFEELLS